jgi:hypothetical protein
MERMWNKATFLCYKKLYQHFPGRIEENYKIKLEIWTSQHESRLLILYHSLRRYSWESTVYFPPAIHGLNKALPLFTSQGYWSVTQREREVSSKTFQNGENGQKAMVSFISDTYTREAIMAILNIIFGDIWQYYETPNHIILYFLTLSYKYNLCYYKHTHTHSLSPSLSMQSSVQLHRA